MRVAFVRSSNPRACWRWIERRRVGAPEAASDNTLHYTRSGDDDCFWGHQLKGLSRACIIDGEAVACDDKGVASFDLVRHHRANGSIFLYAFDLIELNGDDLRRDPLAVRKATLASMLAKAAPGIRLNEHIEADGPTVFAHACKMGPGGTCVEAERLALSQRPIPRLAQDEKPECAGSKAGGGRGLGR
jgi:hypothetical protein